MTQNREWSVFRPAKTHKFSNVKPLGPATNNEPNVWYIRAFNMHASYTSIYTFVHAYYIFKIAGYFYNKLGVAVMRRRCAPFCKSRMKSAKMVIHCKEEACTHFFSALSSFNTRPSNHSSLSHFHIFFF